jgi:hypothetical protein
MSNVNRTVDNLDNILNILSINSGIIHDFNQEIEKLPTYKTQLSELEITLSSPNINRRFQKELLNAINDLKNKIYDISSKRTYNFYIVETGEYLERYRKLLQIPLKMNFMGKRNENSAEKNEIIEKYLTIARKYKNIPTDLPVKNKEINCNNTSCNNKKLFDIIDNSIYICLLCGSQQEILLHISSYKDVDRMNFSTKYTYDRKVHFRDCINQYQGKQNCLIEDKVLVSLEDQFQKHHLLLGTKKDIQSYRFKNITKEHVFIFLKELNYTKHYENANLIFSQLTGKKLDDISYLETKLLDDFDKFIDMYDKKFRNQPDFERSNLINSQYILYQFLMNYHHPCKKEDFSILKTLDRKAFHDEVTKICFEELGWNHTPMF